MSELSISGAAYALHIPNGEAAGEDAYFTEPPRKRCNTIIEGAADYDDTSSGMSDNESLEGPPNTPTRLPDGSRATALSIKVPRHTKNIFLSLVQYLCSTRRVDPMIFVPGSDNYMGSISLFNNRSAFTCCWISHRAGYRMTNLPDVGTVIVFQETSSLGPQVNFSRPNHKYVTLFTPDDKVHKISGPALLRPKNTDDPVVELPVTTKYPASVSLDDFVGILKLIRESMPCEKKPSKPNGKVTWNDLNVNGKTNHVNNAVASNHSKVVDLGTSPEPSTYNIMDVESD
ncbi:hypothetical protein TcWFU_008745 [Taenia crassiceps]|uniref:Uncharacterized protein n=1 Tax=Taenia crassiceps TaxID=6207 RepID=A0ABR4QHV0_9CEST